jgi:hypothetical protein
MYPLVVLHEVLSKRFALSTNRETTQVFYISKVRWADDAYLHAIHKPIENAVVDTVARDLRLPPSLVAFYRLQNGGTLFRASLTCIGLTIFGCWREGQLATRAVHGDSPPIDIRLHNQSTDASFVLFGTYGADGSRLLINRDTEVVSCSVGRDLSKVRKRWTGLEEWLESEVDRLCQLFTPDGVCLVPCAQLLPPSNE